MSDPSDELRYDVFLSYQHDDRPSAAALAERLAKQGFTAFLDRWNLVPGDPWQPELEAAIRQSRTVAILVGAAGIGAWQREEMYLALSRAVRTRDNCRIIPVLLPRAPPEALSGFLASRTSVELSRGVDDPEAFQRLLQAVRGKPGDGPPAKLPDTPAPYVGPRRFDLSEQGYYFGRDGEIEAVLQLLATTGFVAVTGASGAGKSSLVRAGVLPRLLAGARARNQPCRHVTIRPGKDPVGALADQVAQLVSAPEARLQVAADARARIRQGADGFRASWVTLSAGADVQTILVVDQLEELFRQGIPAADQVAFLENLVEAGARLIPSPLILVTVRADRLDPFLKHERFRTLLQKGQFLLGPLGRDGLRDAIVRPAQQVGAYFENGLVGVLLDAYARAPGALSLLQDTLLDLWNKREGVWLTHAAYGTASQLGQALNRRADEALGRLSDVERVVAQELFVRLASWGDGTTRRLSREELETASQNRTQVGAVVDAFVEVRLLVADDESVELAHESIIEGWKKLREWAATSRHAMERQHKLGEEAQAWAANQRHDSFLLMGRRLSSAQEDLAGRRPLLGPLETEFLLASEKHAQREVWKKRRLFGGITAILIGLLGVISYQWWMAAEINRQVIRWATEVGAQKLAIETSKQELQREVLSLKGELSEKAASRLLALAGLPAPVAKSVVPASSKPYVLQLWNRRVLRVRFLDGPKALRKKVMSYAQEWTDGAGIRFAESTEANAEVRVSFAQFGSWALAGKDALGIPRKDPTVNLGFLKEASPDDEIRRYTQHEFGHVLGLVDEHLNPNAKIPWNRDQMYDSFGKQGVTREVVDSTYLRPLNVQDYRAFDRESVMMYPIPASFTTDGTSYEGGKLLSESDKAFVRKLYPP